MPKRPLAMIPLEAELRVLHGNGLGFQVVRLGSVAAQRYTDTPIAASPPMYRTSTSH